MGRTTRRPIRKSQPPARPTPDDGPPPALLRATFVQEGAWWAAWCEGFPQALAQGRTLEEARENLKQALRSMKEPLDPLELASGEVVVENLLV